MKKIKKLFLVFALVFVSTFAFLRANVYHVKAYDSIDSTGATTWNIKSEEVKNKYGVNYSYVIGKPTTQGATGTEKIVNYFSMKPDGVNSKLVTWGVQDGNSGFKTNQLTEIAKDYEKKHPGWIVVSGINADQWYYKTTKNNQKGGYFFCDNPYYPFTMDGQNLFTINPLGGRGNGIAITNNPNNPFISVTNSDRIELQVYDANDQLIATFPVSGYNQNPGASGTTVWSGYVNPETMGKAFINREVNTTNSLFVIENADLAYMNNTRDYAYEGSMYAPVDSFYGKGTISSTINQISLGAGQFAIETTSEEVKAKLAVGVKVIIEQQYSNEGANEVESVTGFHTVQVKDGVYQDSSAPYNLASKPRSIFGVKEDGTYFLLTTRDNKIGSTGGTAHTETQAILSYYGAYTAYQDDGGGSSTAIYRTDSGTFDVVSGSCDSATTLKSQRLVFSGLFFVVKDPGVSIKETTPSSVTLRLNNTQYANSLEDVKAKVNGKTYEMTDGIIKIDDLEENTEYEINIEYKLNDQNLTALTYAKTAEYKPGIKLNPTSDGFIVDIPKVDSELITSKITFLIDDKTIVVDNSAGELESYQITGLYKDMDYEISYTYEVKNIKTNIVGLDLKADVIKKCNEIAKNYGYNSLNFETGDISLYKPHFRVDLIITLHACDVATDYAMYHAIKLHSKYLLSVPCCQHEINNQIKKSSSFLASYGIVKERMSALLTDTIRAKLLEYSGYNVDILEFVDFDASPKNLLVRAKYTGNSNAKALDEVKQILDEFTIDQTLYKLLFKSSN